MLRNGLAPQIGAGAPDVGTASRKVRFGVGGPYGPPTQDPLPQSGEERVGRLVRVAGHQVRRGRGEAGVSTVGGEEGVPGGGVRLAGHGLCDAGRLAGPAVVDRFVLDQVTGRGLVQQERRAGVEGDPPAVRADRRRAEVIDRECAALSRDQFGPRG